MSVRINQFCKGLGMDQELRQSMTEKDISYQVLNKSVADLLSSDDEKDTSKHRVLVESKILKTDSIENYNDRKLQVIFGKYPSGNNHYKNEVEHFYNGTRGEEFKILYIDSLTTLRRIIISRKEIVKENLGKFKIDRDPFADDNDEIIRNFIEYINIKLGKNIYEELRKIYQEETLERVDLVVNKVYDNGLTENHKRRLKNNKDDKGNEKLPNEELVKNEGIINENTINEEISNKKLNKGLGLNDFNILVQEGKIDIKSFKFVINLLNNALKVDINKLYALCENGVIDRLTSSKINENQLIFLINNITTENLDYLSYIINSINTEKLISIINNTNTKKISDLINNTSPENLSYLINNTNPEKLSYLINNINPEKLNNLINSRYPKFLNQLINDTNTENLGNLINNTDTERLSNLINITNPEKLSKLIDIIKTERLINLINLSNIEKLSEAINNDFDKLVLYIKFATNIIVLYMKNKYKL